MGEDLAEGKRIRCCFAIQVFSITDAQLNTADAKGTFDEKE